MATRIGVVVEDVEPEFKPIGIELTIKSQKQLDAIVSMLEWSASTVLATNDYTPMAAQILDQLRKHIQHK